MENMKKTISLDSEDLDKVKMCGQAALEIYASEDKIKSAGMIVPDEYRGQYETAV